ncbi:MAG: hypothetical protein DRN20_01030 [Thermoplasmata archaeon]|nr:MAG: hypothetical protein DRN20_01030 [Thermoplasmata archaeon]
MEYQRWRQYYEQIIEEFEYCEEKDKEAALLLSSLIKKDAVFLLHGLIQNRKVYIIGPAIRSLPPMEGTIIVADDAISSVLKRGVLPHVIVTDLDGDIYDLIYANSMGSVAVIHAHGDNIERISRFFHAFKGPIVGSTQSEPLDNVHNFGGFTDGDRAVFIAHHFGARKIVVLGFDFKNVVIKRKGDLETKRKKLKWARILISELINDGAPVVFL